MNCNLNINSNETGLDRIGCAHSDKSGGIKFFSINSRLPAAPGKVELETIVGVKKSLQIDPTDG